MTTSVIIPTRNRAPYLEQTINSVLNQTVPVYEIIVVDDNSEDNTKEVVDGFNSPKIKYHNFGKINNIGKLRNKGCSIASGDKLAFCDDDDLWEINKLEVQMGYLKDYDFVCCNANLINDKGFQIERLYNNFPGNFEIKTEDLLKSNFILTPSVTFKKKIFDSGFCFNETNYKNLCEDYYLWLKISHSYKMLYLKDDLIKVRLHQSITKSGLNQLKIWYRHIEIINEFNDSEDTILSKAASEGIQISKIEIIKIYFKNHNYLSFLKECFSFLWELKNKHFREIFENKLLKKLKRKTI